jgi:divalent metal cation (Fe/Co/Zn/Cd) transporter
MKIAKEKKSAVLESNAIHHRVDSLTGIVALSTIAISNIVPSRSSLDPVGGLLNSRLVIRAGWTNTMTSLVELADASVADDVKDTVRSVANETLHEVLSNDAETQEVSGTKAGQSYLLDIAVTVPNNLTIEQLSGVEGLIRQRVATKVRGSRRIRVRFVPLVAQDGDFMQEFVPPGISTSSTPNLDKHDHEHNDNTHKSPEHRKENGYRNGGLKKDM